MTYSKAMAAVFARQANAEYLIDDVTGRRFNYGDWLALAERMADGLADRGIGRGDRVAMVLPNCWEFAAFYFACLLRGAAAAPINPDLGDETIEYLISHIAPGLVLTSTDPVGSLGEALRGQVSCAVEAVVLESVVLETNDGDIPAFDPGSLAEAGGAASADPWRNVDDEAVFSICFTSGTTERPKGVAHYVGGLLGNATAFNEVYGFDGGTRMAHYFPMAYMAGFLNTLLSPCMAGGSVLLTGKFGPMTPLKFWRTLRQHDANTLWVSPTMLSAVMALDRDPDTAEGVGGHIKTICVGTAPLPASLKTTFEDRYGVTLNESYGSSELLYITAVSDSDRQSPGTVGVPLRGVVARIVDHQGNDQPADHEGEIRLRSDYSFAGYVDYANGRVEPYAAQSWFHTGDSGHLDPAGRLFVTGRIKDIIIKGGINVSPRAIEEILHRHPQVQHVAVVGVPHEFFGEDIVAAIVVSEQTPGNSVDLAKELQDICRSRLSEVEVPSRIEFLKELPLSSTGKVQKAELRRYLANGT